MLLVMSAKLMSAIAMATTAAAVIVATGKNVSRCEQDCCECEGKGADANHFSSP